MAAGGWDIRARWFGVVVCATPRLGDLGRGTTISWRIRDADHPRSNPTAANQDPPSDPSGFPHIVSAAALGVAVAVVALGASVGSALFIIAGSPALIIVVYETVGYRREKTLLTR